MDAPGERKIHSKSTPRLGGVAVCVSFLLALAILYFRYPDFYRAVVSNSGQSFVNVPEGLMMLLSVLLVLALGIWDDIKSLDPGPKFLIQFIAASLIYFAGFSITTVTNPAGPGVLDLQLLSYPLTVLWIVGITNAFNLIDGLDGLASGVAVIALFTIVGISVMHQQTGVAVIALILSGAILGFLWFNFRPATIFLGDSGSLFLGFFLAVLSIKSFTKVSTTFATLIPVLALGLPILDTSLSMTRRLLSWFLPNNNESFADLTFRKLARSIFTPDKSHIHHRLINRGLSHRNTVLVLYLVSALFCLGAFFVSITDHFDTTVLMVMFVLICIKAGINRLSYDEINLLRNGVFYTLYNYFIINKRYFRKVLDGLFVLIAYLGSYYVLYPNDFITLTASQPTEMILLALFVLVIQMGIFWMSGLYKKTIRQMGIADMLNVFQSVGLAVIATMIIHSLFFDDLLNTSLLLFVINFYFLLTLVLGLRVTFHILRYLFYKSRKNLKRMLIYGADEHGIIALKQSLSINPQEYTLVGFVDEDPMMEGKFVHGYPVFGGHWKLDRLVRSKNIHKLLIANHDLHPKVIRQIHKTAQRYDLDIQLIKVQVKNLDLFTPEASTRGEKISFAN